MPTQEPEFREVPPDVYEREWRAIHDSIFSGRLLPENRPFRNSTWRMFLFPYGLNMDEREFDAIAQAAMEQGDNEFIVEPDVIGFSEPGALLPWSYSVLDTVCPTVLGQLDTHLFGRSGSWGIVCDVEDYSCIGGEASFMDRVVALLGGAKAIRKRFLRFATEEYPFDKEFLDTLLKVVGWNIRVDR